MSKQFKSASNFREDNDKIKYSSENIELSCPLMDIDTITEQDTLTLPAIREDETLSLPITPRPATNKISTIQHAPSNIIQSMVATLLARATAPEPEQWTQTLFQKAIKLRPRVLGWFPPVALICAFGTLIIAYGTAASIRTSSDQETFLWIGLIVIFAPSFFRLLSPLASPWERMGILCVTGLGIYLAPQLISPLHFIFVDEYLHWRTVNDIIRTGHLFTPNSLLPVSPVYPGLEIVTAALSSISGFSTFVSGIIVVGLARIVVTLSLFMLFEHITNSARTAGIATMLYMTNASFFMFDSLFLYESLGLALGAFVLFVVARAETVAVGKRSLLLVACLAIEALTITHHVSDIFFVVLLIFWTIVEKFIKISEKKSNVSFATIIAVLCSVCWVIFFARSVIGYLYDPVHSSLAQLTNILAGTGSVKHLFVDHTGGHPTPLWQRLTMLLDVAFVTLGIPFSSLFIWHRYRYKALPVMLGLVSLIYPFTQALRFTNNSANIADRSSPFVFVAVSFALAVFIVQMWPTSTLRWRHMLTITVVVTIMFLGGNTLGAGPTWRLMPSGYVVGDDGRSVSPEGIEAALWTPSHIGINKRISTDSTNMLLMSTYGNQRVITLPYDGVDVAPVFYAQQFHLWEADILKKGHVQYLVVDLRLSTALPEKGYYFEGDEPPDVNVTTPISRQALTKFDTVKQINRIFDSGDIVIYDVGEITRASQ